MSLQTGCCACGSDCTPLPLPQNTLIVNANDTCNSYNSVKEALAAVNTDNTNIYVLSNTNEPDTLTQLVFTVNIVYKPDVTVTHTGNNTFIIVDAGKTVNIWNGTVNGNGFSVGIYEIWDGNLNMYNHKGMVTSTGGGHTLYPSAGNMYMENCYFSNVAVDTIRVPATIASMTILKSTLICSDTTSPDNVIDDNGAGTLYTIQDSILVANGGSALNFAAPPLNGATPALSSRFFRNTIQAGTAVGAYAVTSAVWNPAYFSMNTVYQGAGGAFHPNITIFAGLTNDII